MACRAPNYCLLPDAYCFSQMKFSLHSVHGGVKNIDEIHKRAVRAEELGYYGIFLGESHLSSIDSFQTLASCAMITKRVLLGIAVTNMVFRHPTVLAGVAASLNEISNWRCRHFVQSPPHPGLHFSGGAQRIATRRPICRRCRPRHRLRSPRLRMGETENSRWGGRGRTQCK